MKTKNAVLGYTIGQVYNGRIENVRHVNVHIQSYRKRDAAKEILDASSYKDRSLEYTLSKVRKAEELGRDHWYDSGWMEPDIDLEFQGSIDRNDWYCCTVRHKLVRENTKILASLLKNIPDIGTPNTLFTELSRIAICMKHIPIERTYSDIYLPMPLNEKKELIAKFSAPLDSSTAAA